MADLKNIIEEIKAMKVTEIAELIKMMEEEFGVSAAPVAVAGAAAPAAAAAVEEKTEFNVKLTSFGANKVGVIKVVRAITGLGLVDAKNLVEGLGVVKEGINKADAEKVLAELKEAGAEAKID
ncbi:MAG: 50S ribosomal protein L7/L12 [Clostridia bacterium]